MKSFIPSVVTAITITLIGVTTLWYGTAGLTAFTAETARRNLVLTKSWPLSPVQVENQDGDKGIFGQVISQYQVVDFIYTRCVTICRKMGSEFTQLQSALITKGLSDHVNLLSISFDSENDTPKALKSYLGRHHADLNLWKGLRILKSDDEQKVLKAFDITVIDDGYGGFEHNAAFYVVKSGKVVGIYDYNDTQSILKMMLKEIKTL